MPNISDLELTNIKFVGRLDYQTEGLILATNNGQFKRFLEMPSNTFIRV